MRKHRLLQRLSGQRGITMIELVTAMALALAVVGAPLTFMLVSFRQHDNVISRTDAIRQAQVGLNQFAHDLRQADPTQSTVLSWSGGTATATFSIVTPGTSAANDQTITWTCTANASCTRKVGTGVATTRILHVVSTSFAATSATGTTLTSPTSASNPPVYVAITMSVNPVTQGSKSHTSRPTGIKAPLTINAGVDLWGTS